MGHGFHGELLVITKGYHSLPAAFDPDLLCGMACRQEQPSQLWGNQ